MKLAVLAREWWDELDRDQQQEYLKQHPHSHHHLNKQEEGGEALHVDYDHETAPVLNYINQGHDLKLPEYLDKHLNEEEKQQLDGVVAGKLDFPSTKQTLRKVLSLAITASIIGAGILVSPALVLSVWAVLKLAHKNPEKWLFNTIYGSDGNDYEAVEKAFKSQKFDFNHLPDEHLNDHLDSMEE